MNIFSVETSTLRYDNREKLSFGNIGLELAEWANQSLTTEFTLTQTYSQLEAI